MLPMVQFARVLGRLVLALVVAGFVPPSTLHGLSAAAAIDATSAAHSDRAGIADFPAPPPRVLSRSAVRIDASRRSNHGTATLLEPLATAVRLEGVASARALTCPFASSARRCSNQLRGPPSLL